MDIRKASGGYIVESAGIERVFTSLDEALCYMLQMFEGRSKYFTGSCYGTVEIKRDYGARP